MTAEPDHDWKSAAGLQFLFQGSLVQVVNLNRRHIARFQKSLDRRRAPSAVSESEAAAPDDTDLETVAGTPNDGTEAVPGFRGDGQPRGRWQVPARCPRFDLRRGRAVCHSDPVSPASGKSVWAFGLPRHYLTAVEFDRFTNLGRDSMDAGQIRETLALHPGGIRDFLDAPMALGLLEGEIDGPGNPGFFREPTVR